jgi:guanylate kinase
MTDDELRTLVASYKPSPKVLQDMANIQVLGLVGPSASGKTTIIKALIKASPRVKFILDETSRAPRPNEVSSVDFLFRTKEEILQNAKAGKLVQVAIGPNDDLYCTHLSSYPTGAIGIIALVPPAVKEFRQLPIKSFQAAFIVPYNFEAWQQWLTKQAKAGDWSQEKLQSRLAEAKQSYEFALNDKSIQFVLNDKIDQAVKRLEQVVAGQPPADEQQARTTATENYARLLELLNKSSI